VKSPIPADYLSSAPTICLPPYALAVQAEQYIPNDPILAKFWPVISWQATIHTVPSGVSVYRRNYNPSDSGWEFVGSSPIENRRLPLVDSRLKFEFLPRNLFVMRVGADGGPLVYNGSEEEQCSLDSTCRKLHRFLNQPSAEPQITHESLGRGNFASQQHCHGLYQTPIAA
jgi:hypothetical protein